MEEMGFTNVILAENELLKDKIKKIDEMIDNFWFKKNNWQYYKLHEADGQTGIVQLLNDIRKIVKE